MEWIDGECTKNREIRLLSAENKRLKAGYNVTGLEAAPCPGCVYKNGVFVERCELHKQIDNLREELLATERAMELKRHRNNAEIERLREDCDEWKKRKEEVFANFRELQGENIRLLNRCEAAENKETR